MWNFPESSNNLSNSLPRVDLGVLRRVHTIELPGWSFKWVQTESKQRDLRVSSPVLDPDWPVQISKFPDVRDVVEWQAHGNLQLGRWHVHPGNGFSHRMLHLETWVQLQEAEGVGLRAVQILHGTCTLVHRPRPSQNRRHIAKRTKFVWF